MRLRNDKFVVAIPAVATTGNAWASHGPAVDSGHNSLTLPIGFSNSTIWWPQVQRPCGCCGR